MGLKNVLKIKAQNVVSAIFYNFSESFQKSFNVYYVLELECRFTLRLNTAKNINYMKKRFKSKLFRIKFPTKNSLGACVDLPQEWSCRVSKIDMFEIYIISSLTRN